MRTCSFASQVCRWGVLALSVLLVFSFCFGSHFWGHHTTPDSASTLCRAQLKFNSGRFTAKNVAHTTAQWPFPTFHDIGQARARRLACQTSVASCVAWGQILTSAWGRIPSVVGVHLRFESERKPDPAGTVFGPNFKQEP